MKKFTIPIISVCLLLASISFAVVPQKWELKNSDEFLKGKFEGVSVSYDGILSLAPQETRIEGPAEEFYLSILQDGRGDIFLGTGHSGKIYRIGRDGGAELYFSVEEMDIYCLVLDGSGNLYAGTSPNGKVYKITDKNKGEPFFNPQEKYIWDLEFTRKGTLLAAVGESGGIYEISPAGEGTKILQSKENHILCLEGTSGGDFIAGSGGRGRLYRILEGGRATILFESPFEEIKSIDFDARGNIYAASGGKISKPATDSLESVKLSSESSVEVTVTAAGDTKVQKAAPSRGAKHPSALYRITPEGIAEKMWESDEDLIYTLAWDEKEKKLLFGTGDEGRLFAVESPRKTSLIHQKESQQVYQIIPNSAGSGYYVLTNNPAGLNLLSSDQRESGEYFSRVYDTRTISSWGKIRWEAVVPSGGVIQFQTRSGNASEPNSTWSDWSPPYQKNQEEQILSPKARYIQFRVHLKIQTGNVSPRLQKVLLYYQQTNLAPEINKIDVLPPNVVFMKPPQQNEIIWGLEEDFSNNDQDKSKDSSIVLAKKTERKGYRTLLWSIEDGNEDGLLTTISIKNTEESKWRRLGENWKEKIFAFDTLSFPDGEYQIRLEISDSPSNPPGTELKSEEISRSFVIDNSLPEIKNVRVSRERTSLKASFSVEDSYSHIKQVQYLILPDVWHSVFPADGICDSRSETFDLNINLPSGADNMIVVKVWDSQDNVGVFRQEF